MRTYRRLTTLFAILLAAILFGGSGLASGWAVPNCPMMAPGARCAAMAAPPAETDACPMPEHAKMASPMPCCQKHAGISRSSRTSYTTPPCRACLAALPALPAAWQSAAAPQVAPPVLDILAPNAVAIVPAAVLQATPMRRGPPRAGPFVPSPILLTPSLRAPPVA